MANNEKALRLLGLARHARRLEAGEEPVVILCRSGKARLVLLASDAGEHTLRRAENLCRGKNTPLLVAPVTKDELGSALGCNTCALCALSDTGFAVSLLQAMEDCPDVAALLPQMQQLDGRMRRRREEARAHRSNVKHGKK